MSPIDAGGRAQRPVATVAHGILIGQVERRIMRHVIFFEDDTRRLAGRTRPELEFHRSRTRPARPREISRKLFFVEIEDCIGL